MSKPDTNLANLIPSPHRAASRGRGNPCAGPTGRAAAPPPAEPDKNRDDCRTFRGGCFFCDP